MKRLLLMWVGVLAVHGAEASSGRQAGEVFKDCADCPEMVVIPAGRFEMGSPAGEEGRMKDEGPLHMVRIGAAFALGRTEVTVGEFHAFVSSTGYRTEAERDVRHKGCYVLDEKWVERPGADWQTPGFSQTGDHPVVCVSWNDAQAYVKWLNGKVGSTAYRLPSESEWEYAARAGSVSARPWGEGANGACAYANVADATLQASVPGDPDWGFHDCRDGAAYTAKVGQYRANGFGLNDMIGNAMEWVQDCWADGYNAGQPTDGGAWEGGKCILRVSRVGGWYSLPEDARSATRDWAIPAARYSDRGFRLARTLP